MDPISQAQSLAFQTPDICSTDKDVKYKMAPNWCFDVDIGKSVVPKIRWGREPRQYFDQVVKMGKGWVDLETVLLINCRVAK
jgi:hypothetical protein